MNDAVVSTEDVPEAADVRGEISALSFSDLFLEPEVVWYRKSPRNSKRGLLSEQQVDEARLLRKELQRHSTGQDFRLAWHGMEFRVQRITTLKGDVYACRRLREKPIPFEDLGYPRRLKRALLSDDFSRGGLVLFTGGTGDGKSMTQASWLIARLRQFGGTAWMIEHPAEMLLQGDYSSPDGSVVGTLYQTQVQSDAEFGNAISQLLRAAPDMFVFGEIRNRAVACEAVLAATSGHLVAATYHANNIEAALQRMTTMIRDGGLDVSFFAESLCAIVHQEMTVLERGGKEIHNLTVMPLIIKGAINETGTRNNLRNGDFGMLVSELKRQERVAGGGTTEEMF